MGAKKSADVVKVTEITHVRANRLLMSMKRLSCRRCRPRSDFENGS